MTKATPDVTTLLAYADNLEELPIEALVEAFERAETVCQYLPTVPELREMVGHHVAHLEELELDAAWAWVQDYIAKFGPDGEPHKLPKLTDKQRESCERCNGCGFVDAAKGMKKCPCREASVDYPPLMPTLTEYALRQMANNARDAMRLIQGANGQYVHKQNKLRGQFNEAYRRAKLARKQQAKEQ